MEKMGVDVLAVSARSSDPVLRGLWQSRTGDYLHLILAERDGPEGIYLGGYVDDPAQQEADGLVARYQPRQKQKRSAASRRYALIGSLRRGELLIRSHPRGLVWAAIDIRGLGARAKTWAN